MSTPNRGSIFLLTIVLFVFFWIYNFPFFWKLPPQGSHIWRQSDCMAMVNNFKENKLPFFQPETYNLQSEQGKCAGEFPILYYIAAKFSDPTYALRVIDSFIFILGVIAVFFIAFYFLQDELLALLPSLLLFTSPLLVFYGNNFLSDVPALSFAYIGWAFFFYSEGRKSKVIFLLALVFFVFSVLLKASQLLNFAILFIYLFAYKKEAKFSSLFSLCLFALIPVAWYAYAKWYNAQHHDTYYFLGIYPIWKLSVYEIGLCIWRMTMSWGKNYFWPTTSVLLIIASALLWKHKNKLHPELRLLLLYSFLFTTLYILLYFQRMIRHEYYYVAFYVFVLFFLISLLLLYKKFYAENIFSHTALFLFLIPNLVFCNYYIHEKLKDNRPNAVLSSSGFQYFLEKNGVTKDKMVLILPDISTNITLNQIHRKGYTAYNTIDEVLKQHKADFILLGDSSLITNMRKYIATDTAATYREMFLYRLKKE
ncbi:MAG TPA: hypothetical protein PKO18_03705 [Chitinophagales bacterium]|nr:hypothetical protein [Chitinophagales bacterium]HNL84319.1 hypothetical protein [Chitinophagales bacterium]